MKNEREQSTRINTNRRVETGISTIQYDKLGRPISSPINKDMQTSKTRRLISAQERFNSQIDEIEDETGGYLTRDKYSEEEHKLLKIFQNIDNDNSGYIDWHELKKFLA